jgi:nucleotide-binding universal stress UspA family protein
VAGYLSDHDIKAIEKIRARADNSIASELIRIAGDEKADLIVAGAYGHSRLGEWIFGGVTHELLYTCPVCCLLSH